MVVFKAKEISSSTYRGAYKALNELRLEILLATAILFAAEYIKITQGELFRTKVDFQDAVVDLALEILLIFYTIGIFRHTLSLPHLNIWTCVQNTIQIKYFLAYIVVLNVSGGLIAIVFDMLEPYSLVAAIASLIPLVWISMRLFVMGPTLAVADFNATVFQALQATAGRTWILFKIVVRVSMPLLGVAAAAGATFISFYFVVIGIWPNVSGYVLSRTLYLVFIVSLNVVGTTILTVLEAQMFEILLLSKTPREPS